RQGAIRQAGGERVRRVGAPLGGGLRLQPLKEAHAVACVLIIFFCSSASISLADKPSSAPNTSRLCWPINGAGLVIAPGVSENPIHGANTLTLPASGCSTSTKA